MIFNPLSIQDLAALWEGLRQASVMPAITYVARLVSIESDVAIAAEAAEPRRTWYVTKRPD